MPVFTYSGTDAGGKKVAAEIIAPNKQVAKAQLAKQRVNVSSMKEKGKEFALPTFGSSKVPTKDIAIFFRQFSVMI
ncbi:MAG: type II secretion system F family protein, partial [Terriglobales bacterium]